MDESPVWSKIKKKGGLVGGHGEEDEKNCIWHSARSGSVWVALVVKNIVLILLIFNVSIVF